MKKDAKFSLTDIFARLTQSAPTVKDLPTPEPDQGRVTQSIRFPPDLRQWVAAQADHFGISQQDFISLTIKGVKEASQSPHADALDIIASRFFRLFDEHNVATADIPDFLPPGTLSRSDLRDNDAIVNSLTKPVIEHLENTFYIDGDWLLNKSNYIYKRQRFYKFLPTILAELTRLKHRPSHHGVEVLFLTPTGMRLEKLAELKASENDKNKTYSKDQYTNVHVVVKVKKTVNGHDITAYQLWDALPWDYWRSRYHAKALLHFCDKTRVYPTAFNLEKGLLQEVVAGKIMLPCIEKLGEHWYIEELSWDEERNTERDELETIREYFVEQRGKPYLTAIREPYKIKNYDEFIAGMASPQLTDLDDLDNE